MSTYPISPDQSAIYRSIPITSIPPDALPAGLISLHYSLTYNSGNGSLVIDKYQTPGKDPDPNQDHGFGQKVIAQEEGISLSSGDSFHCIPVIETNGPTITDGVPVSNIYLDNEETSLPFYGYEVQNHVDQYDCPCLLCRARLILLIT